MVPPAQATIPQATPEPTVVIQRQEISDVMLSAFSALGYAVSARFLLLLSLLGAFALAVMSMLHPDALSITILVAFCVLTVLPLVGLEIRNKRGN